MILNFYEELGNLLQHLFLHLISLLPFIDIYMLFFSSNEKTFLFATRKLLSRMLMGFQLLRCNDIP